MEELFTPLSHSIKQIFGNIDSLYRIPRYQRPYRWTDDQIDKLWDDIFEASKRNDDYYFLGSMIVSKNSDNDYWDVIDGQQRLTTLIILFKVITELYPTLNSSIKEDGKKGTIGIDVLKNSVVDIEKKERLKLITHSTHQSDFRNIIINGKKEDWKKPDKKNLKESEPPKYKFMNAASVLKNKLESVKINEIECFVSFLFNKVYMIRINCTSTKFAIRMFQVLNNRGLELSSGDLIKSYLLDKIEVENMENEEIKKYKEDIFGADWATLEQIIKNIDLEMDELLVIYEYYLLSENPKKSLYEELEQQFVNADPNEVISRIKEFAETYSSKIYDSLDVDLYGFRYLRWNIYWKTILLTALCTNYEEYERLKKNLLRFYYLYWIAGKTLSKIKQTSFNLIKWIKQKRRIEEIEKELNNKIENDKIISEVILSLSSEDVYNSIWIKPLLVRIEYNQTDGENVFIELDRNLQVEHICPEKYKKYKEWTEMLDEEFAEKWLNKPGNLTLLSGKKNIEASNNPFEKKIKVYKGKGLEGDKNNKITRFQITQMIYNDYNESKYHKQWNKNAIISRWKWFCDETEMILNIDLEELKSKYD
jgi:uncharacterized protein with ParB-like and HNH nuclease domain